MVPLGAGRAEVELDFTELFADRSMRYGRWYAHRRLSSDIFSLWRGTPRGGHVFQDLRFGLISIRELVAYLKANPNKVNLGTAGAGAANHLASEYFKSTAGVFIERRL